MRGFRIARDIFVIFTAAFTAIMLITMLAGAEYSNNMIWGAMLIAALYAVLALMLFSEKLRSRRWFMGVQILYVILLNVVYIVVTSLAGWSFSSRGYIINAICSVVVFCIVKALIFSMDKQEANRINEMLRKFKQK